VVHLVVEAEPEDVETVEAPGCKLNGSGGLNGQLDELAKGRQTPVIDQKDHVVPRRRDMAVRRHGHRQPIATSLRDLQSDVALIVIRGMRDRAVAQQSRTLHIHRGAI